MVINAPLAREKMSRGKNCGITPPDLLVTPTLWNIREPTLGRIFLHLKRYANVPPEVTELRTWLNYERKRIVAGMQRTIYLLNFIE